MASAPGEELMNIDSGHPSSVETNAPNVDFKSKFLTEFSDIKPLGAGGFGQVFQATNDFDGRRYAIKRVRLPSKKEDREKVMREVKAMARLDHPNIVRYHCTWLESPPGDWKLGDRIGAGSYASSTDEYSLSSSENRTMATNSTTDEYGAQSASESVAGVQPASAPWTKRFADENVGNILADPEMMSKCEEGGQKMSASNEQPANKVDRVYLYIQIELCQKETLKDWLMSNQGDGRPTKAKLGEMFLRIVEAVVYIHKQGLIHRDLKPSNIFFAAEDNRIKVGDFGLVAAVSEDVDCKMFAEVTTENVDKLLGGGSCRPPVKTTHFLTKEVGTKLYMSPEQIAKKPYSSSVDVYSLGLILFELLYPMSTDMEKQNLLTDLKLYLRFPVDFDESLYSAEKSLLQRMLAHNPAVRPTTEELLVGPYFFMPPSRIDHGEKVSWKEYRVKPATTFFEGPSLYPMKKKIRGYVLLINNEELPRKSRLTRTTTQRMYSVALRSVFQQLQFIVEDHHNKNCQEMEKIIQEFAAKPDHAEAEACFVIIMSHGSSGKASSKDYVLSWDHEKIDMDWIHDQFSPQMAPLLARKPKVFIYQLLEKLHPPHNPSTVGMLKKDIQHPSNGGSSNTVVHSAYYAEPPGMAPRDMLVLICLTTSAQKSIGGTWFIQALCEMLEEHAADTDFHEIVHKKVAERVKPLQKRKGEHRSIRIVSFGFRKKMFLNPGLFEDAGRLWSLQPFFPRWYI